MPEVDLAEFRAEMETEREWREAEMRQLRNHIARIPSEAMRRTARKSLVVMLYAHFEGVSKALLSMYVNRLNALGLCVGDVAAPIGAASLAEVFRALRDPNKKCSVFARALPNDSALHRFARDREFVEVAWKIAKRSVLIDPDEIVDTESNLKPVVLRKILFRLGLDPGLAQPWEGVIHRLLNHRNNIAHGTPKTGLEEKEYAELEQAVCLVVDDIVKAVCEAIARKAYLLTPSAGVSGASSTTFSAQAGEGHETLGARDLPTE